MTDLALIKKLNVRPGMSLKTVNMPDELSDLLSIEGSETSATLLFVHTVAEFEHAIPGIVSTLPPSHLLWIAFPKKTSKIKTDISRDNGWDILKSIGYRTVNLIAIDDNWSAFRVQPIGTTASLGRRDPSEPRPELQVPDDLAALLVQRPVEAAFFGKLSYTCKREYIQWIEEAKRPETRQKRLFGTLEKLASGVKSPIR